jgi:hypothetical protein
VILTPNQFRRAALALPDTIESSHMGTVDFRVGGKIFATLGYPDASFGMVQLTPDHQALLGDDPESVRSGCRRLGTARQYQRPALGG